MPTQDNGDMIIVEIMYDPESSEDDWEWIEIYNNGNIEIDLSGYVIDDNNGLDHSAANIINGTIAAGETAILFNDDDLDAADFEAAWGTGINLIGVTSWNRMGLNNTGDKVSLWSSFSNYSGDHQTHANAIDTVDYNLTGFPDPVGSSIYLINLNLDNSIGSHWAVSNDGETTPAGTGYISSNTNGNTGNDIGSPGGNFPPTLSGTPDTIVNEDSSYSFIPTANDANNDNLTFSIVNQPSWAIFNPNTGELSGTPTNDHVGITSDIVISVNDGTYTVSLAAFNLTVNNTNDHPSFSSTAVTEVLEDNIYNYNISTTDPDLEDSLTITATNIPSWLNFQDNGNGTATLTGTPTNNEVGTHSVELKVEDALNATATQSFNIIVNNSNDDPSFSSTAVTEVFEDSIYNYNISTTDPDLGDSLTITAKTLPSWLNFQDHSNGTAILTGTPTNNEVGTHSIELKVEDASSSTATQSFNIVVNNSNDTPSFSSTAVTEVFEDSIYNYKISTTDPDVGDSLTITATTVPSWLNFQDHGDGTAILTGTPTNNEVGTHSVELKVEDASSSTATQSFNIVVNNSNDTPSFSSTAVTEVFEDSIYNYKISTTDPDVGDSLTITATTVPSWLNFQDHGDGTAILTGTPTNNEVGTHSVELKVEDASSSTATQSFNIVVNNSNDTPNLNDTSFNINENATNNISVGSVTGTDIDNGDQLTYSIIAGNEDKIFKIDSNTGEITVQDNTNLDFETISRYILTVQVQDDGVGFLTDTANITVNIADINETPTHLSLSNSNIHENEPIGTIIGDFSTTDQDNADFHSYSFVSGIGDPDNDKFEIIGNQLFTQASFDFETQSSYTIRVQTADSNGLTFEKILTLNIIDIDDLPIVKNAIADIEVNEDAEKTQIDLSQVFSDIDNDDSSITKIITANSNENLVQTTLNGDLLTLDYQDNNSGIAEITIQAISNGEIVTDILTVTVNPVDDLPIVENAIADIEVDEDAEKTQIDLSQVFSDIDNDDSSITKIITANSNENLVQTTLNGDLLTLDYQDNNSGIAEITIQAISNGEIVTDTFKVKVNAVDEEVELIPRPEPSPEVQPQLIPEAEAEPILEPEVEVQPQLQPQPILEAEPIPEAEVEVQPQPQPQPILEAEPIPEAEVEVQPQPQPQPILEAEPIPEAEVEVQPQLIPEAEAKPILEPEVQPQPISEAETIDEPEVEVQPQLIPEAEAKPILEPEVQPQPISEAETIDEPEVEGQPQLIPEAEAKPILEPEVEVQPQPISEAETIDEPEVEVQPQPQPQQQLEVELIPELEVQQQPEATSQLVFQQPTPIPDPLPPLPQTLFDPTLDVPSVPQLSQMLITDLTIATTSEHLNKPTSNSDVLLMKNNEQILALESDDTVMGNDNENWINGNLGEDAIAAGGGNDTVYGGQDSDTIQGGREDDWINSDQGDDFVDGGEGNDSVYGGQNNDTALGGEGNDHVSGNLGNDLIEGNTGNDSLYGGQDNDTISGNIGNDELYGDKGDDLLDGNEGSDFLNGGEGDDTLDGGEGEDQLTGGEGDDWLVGGEGNDTLTGGVGRDRFVLSFNTGLDLITDFDTEQDLLKLDASLTYDDLILTQSGNATLILVNDQLIAILEGVNSNLLTSENVTSLI